MQLVLFVLSKTKAPSDDDDDDNDLLFIRVWTLIADPRRQRATVLKATTAGDKAPREDDQ